MSKAALERCSKKHAAWKVKIGSHYLPHQTVCVDESVCDKHTMYRSRAWAYSGARAFRYAHFVRGKQCTIAPMYYSILMTLLDNRYSILPAICLDGILDITVIEVPFRLNEGLGRTIVSISNCRCADLLELGMGSLIKHRRSAFFHRYFRLKESWTLLLDLP